MSPRTGPSPEFQTVWAVPRGTKTRQPVVTGRSESLGEWVRPGQPSTPSSGRQLMRHMPPSSRFTSMGNPALRWSRRWCDEPDLGTIVFLGEGLAEVHVGRGVWQNVAVSDLRL